MQVVLLAAGLGARMRPDTHTTPKPLLPVNDKPILQYVLEALPQEIDEIILVVNHLQEQIISFVGDTFQNRPVVFVTQDPLTGTAGALHLVKDLLKDRFLVINTDNIYDPKSIHELLKYNQSILVANVPTLLSAAAQSEDEIFTGLGACTNPPCQIVCGAYVLNRTFFDLPLIKIQIGSHSEFGLPQTLVQSKQPIHIVQTDYWFPIGTADEWKLASQGVRVIL